MRYSFRIKGFLILVFLISQLISASTSWQQDAQLTAVNSQVGDSFGWSVSVSGNISLVGAPYHDVGGEESCGEAYIFRSPDGGATWPSSATQDLTASNKAAGDHFGLSVSVSGNTTLIGAPKHDSGGTRDSGEAYIFLSSDGGVTWPATETAQLIASDKAVGDRFGWSVSVSGNVALIGAPLVLTTTTPVVPIGAAYIFQTTDGGSSWNERQKLLASDKAALDVFGSAVSVSGSVAVIGAPNHNSGGLKNSGQAYIFRSTDGGATWSEIQKLTASNKAANNYLGLSASISGSIALIGAPYHASGGITDCGAAYIFHSSDGGATWSSSETQMLTASDKSANDKFGVGVSVSDYVALVGAPDHDSGGLSNSGEAYIFESTDGGVTWSSPEKEKLTASDKAVSDWFGASVAVSGNIASIGAPDRASGGISRSGAAYIFDGTSPAPPPPPPPTPSSSSSSGSSSNVPLPLPLPSSFVVAPADPGCS